MMRRQPLFILALALVSLPALAHPGHGDGLGSLGATLVHPLLGTDHGLALLAIGGASMVLGRLLAGRGRLLWGLGVGSALAGTGLVLLGSLA